MAVFVIKNVKAENKRTKKILKKFRGQCRTALNFDAESLSQTTVQCLHPLKKKS